MALTMGKMPAWGQPVAAAVFAAGLFLVQYKLPPGSFSEKKQMIGELQQNLDAKQAEIRKGEIALAKLEELQRDIAALEVKLEDLKQILPTAPEMGDLLKWIKSLADQTNLELQTFKPEALADQEFLREQPVTMQVIGNYHQLGLFYDRISKYARIINVENVKMSRNTDRTVRATIRADFVAKTFIYKDEAAGKPGGGA